MTAGLVVIVLLGTMAGGFVAGLSGFAFGLLALSFWAWALDPRLLAPMVVFGSIASQLISLGIVRRTFDWRRAMPFLLGGVPGIPLGVFCLNGIDITLFRTAVGAILIVYSSVLLLAANHLRPWQHGGRFADGCVGLIGGAMGGLAGLTGPAPTLWCTMRGWDKATQRSVFMTFNLVMQSITLLAYGLNGKLTAQAGTMFALMVPAILVSAWAGSRLFTRISEPAFRRVVLLLLLFSGATLLASAFR